MSSLGESILGRYMTNSYRLTKEQEQKALDIHAKSIVIDGLGCPTETGEQFSRMIQGGVSGVNWTIVDLGHEFADAAHDVAKWYSLFRDHEDKIMMVTLGQHVLDAKNRRKLGIIFGLQDPRPIGDDITLLEALYRLGVRVIQLTYNERNLIGDGAGEETDCGLSSFGEKAVEEMNRLGILIDLSHCGRRTGIEATETSKHPVVFSHANAKALCKSTRNKSDEELKMVAEKGGVIGANSWGPTIWSRQGQAPTIEDYLNQIDYMVRLVGADHVGIGLDISEGVYTKEIWTKGYKAKYPQIIPDWITFETKYAQDLNSYLHVPNITKGLVGRGYSDQEIKKILGGNFLRVFETTWK